jgi:hypothetical protein
MLFKFGDKLFNSKLLNDTECHDDNLWDFSDDIVPERLRESLVSQESEQLDSTTAFSFTAENDDKSNQDKWEMAQMCPNDCNCGNCPLAQEQLTLMEPRFNSTQSVMSLHTSISSISFASKDMNKHSTLTISHIVRLQNFGAILHWYVTNHDDIRGYKVYLNGSLVTTVHSPLRTSALIESVNMDNPQHFAVSVIPCGGKKKIKTSSINMQAVYMYMPKEFVQ